MSRFVEVGISRIESHKFEDAIIKGGCRLRFKFLVFKLFRARDAMCINYLLTN